MHRIFLNYFRYFENFFLNSGVKRKVDYLCNNLTKEMDDLEILKQIQEGNKGAFEILFKQYYRMLVIFAAKYLRSIEEAEELVQQVFVSFWEKAARTDINISLKAYLYRWTANACINRIKHLKIKDKYAQYAVTEIQNSFDDNLQFTEPDLKEKIDKAIDNLPAKCREIFIKSRFENKKNHEIATELGISEKTVENQMTIALKKLRADLAQFL